VNFLKHNADGVLNTWCDSETFVDPTLFKEDTYPKHPCYLQQNFCPFIILKGTGSLDITYFACDGGSAYYFICK
jgi:hypothetical protein